MQTITFVLIFILILKGDYALNECRTADCIPCKERFALCKNKTDGPNALPGEVVTSRYVECSQGVATGIKSCQDRKIFSPQERKCKISNQGRLVSFE